MTTQPIRIAIADDQALVRAGFRLMLEAQPDMTVVGEAANGAEAMALVRRLSPNVILMDIRMPEMDGLEATRRATRCAGRRCLISIGSCPIPPPARCTWSGRLPARSVLNRNWTGCALARRRLPGCTRRDCCPPRPA